MCDFKAQKVVILIMKKTPLKQRILNYLNRRGEWVNGGEIERLAESAGYKGSNASRRCRELYEEDLIDRDDNRDKKHTVWYRSKTPLKKVYYKVMLPEGEKIITAYE